MIDFPYTIEDEPAEHWTVEHVLQWWTLRAHSESEAQYNSTVEELSKQLEAGKKELWEAHEQVSEIIRESEKSTDPKANAENEHQQQNANQKPKPSSNNNSKRQPPKIEKPSWSKATTTAKATRPVRTKKPTEKAAAAKAVATAEAPASKPVDAKPDTIHIDIVGGPYDGKFYDLQPKPRSPAWVGRSTSAKFKDRGISLPLDLEVSTSHGRFEFKQGKFYFTDVASTNGTRLNGEDCMPNQPYLLDPSGTTILAGQTTMKVTLLKLA